MIYEAKKWDITRFEKELRRGINVGRAKVKIKVPGSLTHLDLLVHLEALGL